MEGIKSYILSLAGFSFISSLIFSLLPEMPAKRTVKFICGIILSVLILSPAINLNPDFSDIFEEAESYNLNDDITKMQNFNQTVLADKVSEIVEKRFKECGVENVLTTVDFDAEGNIISVKINAYNQQAAKTAAAELGLPYEIMIMTE